MLIEMLLEEALDVKELPPAIQNKETDALVFLTAAVVESDWMSEASTTNTSVIMFFYHFFNQLAGEGMDRCVTCAEEPGHGRGASQIQE